MPQDSTSVQRPRRAVVVLLRVRSLHGAADAGHGRVERAVFNAQEGGGDVGGGGYGAGRWGWKRERRRRHRRSRGWRGRGKGSMGGGIVWLLLFYRLLFSQRDARKADPKTPGLKEDVGKASTAQYEHVVPRRSSRNSVFFMAVQPTEGVMATGYEILVIARGVMRVPKASERIRHGQGCRLDGPIVQLTATPHGDLKKKKSVYGRERTASRRPKNRAFTPKTASRLILPRLCQCGTTA